jgi:hypothetical protein
MAVEVGFGAFAESELPGGVLKLTIRKADPINNRIVATAAERKPKDRFRITKG